jgi:mono/diheme cytochrome c family protein
VGIISAVILVVGALFVSLAYYIQTWRGAPDVDSSDKDQIALGRVLYEKHCASCHGVRLEGQPDWQRRLPSGRLPAPPHDETGHTWHHADRALFGVTKYGLVPPYAPAGYPSDMPAFQSVLSDNEIRAVLAYIKSHWPDEIMRWRAKALKELEQP